MDLTEAEDIKKRWQEYTEELYKKDLHDPDNHDGVKYPLGVSNFLEEISSLPHSVVLFYFFALIPEEGFLISPCYSLELCIQMLYLSFSPLLFASLLFITICKASPDSHFPFLHFFFLGVVLITASKKRNAKRQNGCLRRPYKQL